MYEKELEGMGNGRNVKITSWRVKRDAKGHDRSERRSEPFADRFNRNKRRSKPIVKEFYWNPCYL